MCYVFFLVGYNQEGLNSILKKKVSHFVRSADTLSELTT